MGSQGVTFPRGICMLIEDTGNPGTASRSQMKEVLKVEERGGHSPQGPCCVGHVDLACVDGCWSGLHSSCFYKEVVWRRTKRLCLSPGKCSNARAVYTVPSSESGPSRLT